MTKVPLYQSLMREIIARINSMDSSEPRQLPTEAELCKQHGVSRITVRRALSELTAQGLIQRVHGRGTFALPPKNRQIPADTIHRQFTSLAGVHETIDSGVVSASTDVALLLDISEGEPVFRFARRKVSGAIPVIYEQCYVAVPLLPEGWLRSQFDRDVLFLDIFTELGLRPPTSRLLLTAARAGRDEQEHLSLPADSPVLHIRRVALNAEREPIWLVANSMRSDMGAYEMEVSVPTDS